MKTIDNCLPKPFFDKLQQLIIWNNQFPFGLGKGVATGEEVPSDFNDWYATHLLLNSNYVSQYYSQVLPLISNVIHVLNLKSLLRVKVNFYPYTGQLYEHPPHTDYPFENKAALLSLNTCDGFTRLHDGTKVDSIANRLLLFDGDQLHNSSTTTNARGRWNINFNYTAAR